MAQPQYEPTEIPGVHIFTPAVFGDSRGSFHEWFKAERLRDALGYTFEPQQGNMSVSSAGVVRGLHTCDVGPGQAKMVTCPAGRITDIIVDLRKGSPTYLKSMTVELNAETRRAVYLPIGMGHGFVAHEDNSVLMYLTNWAYDPEAEFPINIMDPALGLDLASLLDGREPILSDRDRIAPTLAEQDHRLPTYEACLAREAEYK